MNDAEHQVHDEEKNPWIGRVPDTVGVLDLENVEKKDFWHWLPGALKRLVTDPYLEFLVGITGTCFFGVIGVVSVFITASFHLSPLVGLLAIPSSLVAAHGLYREEW